MKSHLRSLNYSLTKDMLFNCSYCSENRSNYSNLYNNLQNGLIT